MSNALLDMLLEEFQNMLGIRSDISPADGTLLYTAAKSFVKFSNDRLEALEIRGIAPLAGGNARLTLPGNTVVSLFPQKAAKQDKFSNVDHTTGVVPITGVPTNLKKGAVDYNNADGKKAVDLTQDRGPLDYKKPNVTRDPFNH